MQSSWHRVDEASDVVKDEDKFVADELLLLRHSKAADRERLAASKLLSATTSATPAEDPELVARIN